MNRKKKTSSLRKLRDSLLVLAAKSEANAEQLAAHFEKIKDNRRYMEYHAERLKSALSGAGDALKTVAKKKK